MNDNNGENITECSVNAESNATSDNPDYPDSRLAGLTPFSKGKSGNPNGLKPGTKTKRGLRSALVAEMVKDGDKSIVNAFQSLGIELNDKSIAGVIAYAVSLKAQQGDLHAVKIICDETELPHPKDVKLSGHFIVNMPPIAADCL